MTDPSCFCFRKLSAQSLNTPPFPVAVRGPDIAVPPMKVLIADDDPTIRSELATLVREQGHEVGLASDGAEAIRKLEAEAFDVALVDLVMPRATGLDVLHRIRVVRPSTAFIVITGQGTIEAAVDAMKSGAADFIEKPFEAESLERSLRILEEERRARGVLGAAETVQASLRRSLDDAASRRALLAVLGPAGAPPVGDVRILRLTDDPASPDEYAPDQLYRLNAAVEDHIARTDGPVVYLGDLAPLERVHGREDVAAWIRQLAGRCGGKAGRVVVAAAGAASWEAEAGSIDERLQGLLESLANPVRRAIVGYVFSAGPVAYSAILRRNFVDSSSKLSFHLGKLQSDGLLAKVAGGAYALTEDGRRAWRVLKALAEEPGRQSKVLNHGL